MEKFKKWWDRTGEDAVNLALLVAIAIGSLWVIYIWLNLPSEAPWTFAAGFFITIVQLFRSARQRSNANVANNAPSPPRPSVSVASRIGEVAFRLFFSVLFASWVGGFAAAVVTVASHGGISTDCPAGVPMRYC